MVTQSLWQVAFLVMAHNEIIKYKNFYLDNGGKDWLAFDQLKKELDKLKTLSGEMRQIDKGKKTKHSFKQKKKKLKT